MAQSTESTNNDWNEITRQNGVVFYVKRAYCDVIKGQKPLYYSFMKIVNTTGENYQLSFNFGLQYEEGCSGCEDFTEHHVTMILTPNQIIEGECDFKNVGLTRLIVNPNLSGGWKFQQEVITNLDIK